LLSVRATLTGRGGVSAPGPAGPGTGVLPIVVAPGPLPKGS
jgi:hypothetical protein